MKGAWNVRSLYRSGSFTTAARELARYKLDLVGVQEVRWDKQGIEQEIIIFLWKRKQRSSIGNRIVLAVQRDVSDKIWYIVLRVCWYKVLNGPAPRRKVIIQKEDHMRN